MTYADAIALVRTRREVRGCLAHELEVVIKSRSQLALAAELAQLPTGSDREIIQTSQQLEKSFGRGSATQAKSASDALGCQVRDLFTEALHRMKELPPDARETVAASPPPVAGAATSVKRRG